MNIELPYPPSVNHLWRRVGHRTLLSRGGRAFRRAVQAALAARGVRPIAGRLAVTIDLHPPDHRRRDLDNALKALLDALQHGGAYHDDAQIDDLHIRRGACVPGGRVCVRLVPHPDPGPAGEQPPEAPPGTSAGANQRTCLKCSKLFPSSGPGNRICRPCRGDNDRLRLSELEVQRQRGAKRHNSLELPGDDSV
jgi:Holliday junction resolvase RusA-like endonuclease